MRILLSIMTIMRSSFFTLDSLVSFAWLITSNTTDLTVCCSSAVSWMYFYWTSGRSIFELFVYRLLLKQRQLHFECNRRSTTSGMEILSLDASVFPFLATWQRWRVTLTSYRNFKWKQMQINETSLFYWRKNPSWIMTQLQSCSALQCVALVG